jgi:hypothetical protein
MQASGQRYCEKMDRPGGSGGAIMPVIVIDPRTSNPAALVLHGGVAAAALHAGRKAVEGWGHCRHLAELVDKHRCAVNPARRSVVTLPACDASMHGPLIRGEATMARPGKS